MSILSNLTAIKIRGTYTHQGTNGRILLARAYDASDFVMNFVRFVQAEDSWMTLSWRQLIEEQRANLLIGWSTVSVPTAT